MDNQYYSEEQSTLNFEYSIPEPDYYRTNSRPACHSQKVPNPDRYEPPPPNPDDIRQWYGHGHGHAQCRDLHAHHLFGEKMHSLESRKAHK